MKIHEFVVSSLIVGILGSTVAQDQTGTKNSLDSIVAPRQPRFQRYAHYGMREKCRRNGGPTAYEDSNFENSTRIFISCVQTLVNLTQFETEMADARPDNEQDTVIAKYCLRVPAFEQCIENITESIAPCLEQRERESVDILFGITKSLLKFACKDGKREIEGILGFTVVAEETHPRPQRCLENRMRIMCNLSYQSSLKNLVNCVRSLMTINQFEAKPNLKSDNRVNAEISHENAKVLPKFFRNDRKKEIADSNTAMQDCFIQAFRAPKLVATAASGPETLPEGNDYANMDKYRQYSVKVFEKCERVVAQMVDSLFNLLERDSLDDGTKEDLQKDSSSHNTEGTAVIKNTGWKSEEESDLIQEGGRRSTRASRPLLMKRTIPQLFAAMTLFMTTMLNMFSIMILITRSVISFLTGIPAVFG